MCILGSGGGYTPPKIDIPQPIKPAPKVIFGQQGVGDDTDEPKKKRRRTQNSVSNLSIPVNSRRAKTSSGLTIGIK